MEDSVIESMSATEKEWFALSIVGMIWADGRVDKAELAYLKNIIGFLKDKKLINSMLAMVKRGSIPELTDLSIDQKRAAYILSQLTTLSIVDEELAPNEEKFLKLVADRLGLPPGVSNKFVAHARKQVGEKKRPGKLTVGSKESDVHCFGMSQNECLLYADQAINPQARVALRLNKEAIGEEKESLYQPIMGRSSWCRPIKSRFGTFVVKIVFQQVLQESQGLELIQDGQLQNEKAKSAFKPSNKSLLGAYVQCRICGKKNVPFWMLRSKSMNTRNNLFGIPVYHKAKTGKEFCDFNLNQVAVCPQCLFASNQVDCFKKQSGSKGAAALFDVQTFGINWNKSLPIREQILGSKRGWLKKDNRSPDQAILSYELALMTSDHLASTTKDELSIEHQRRSVSYLLIQAELLMNKGEREKAETCIGEVEKRLEGLFSNLSGAPVIRSAFVLAITKIYLKKYDEAGDYLNFLKNFDRTRTVVAGSPEYKTLNQVTAPAETAWQERAEYAHDVLSDYHLEE